MIKILELYKPYYCSSNITLFSNKDFLLKYNFLHEKKKSYYFFIKIY
jgi:hypothetical protein